MLVDDPEGFVTRALKLALVVEDHSHHLRGGEVWY